MDTPPEEMRIRCPRCGAQYDAWREEEMNLDLDTFDDESLESASSASCPMCGLTVSFDELVAVGNGAWTTPEGSAADDEELDEGEEYDGEGEVWDEEEEEGDEEEWEEEP
jgi:hypothetical protein